MSTQLDKINATLRSEELWIYNGFKLIFINSLFANVLSRI